MPRDKTADGRNAASLPMRGKTLGHTYFSEVRICRYRACLNNPSFLDLVAFGDSGAGDAVVAQKRRLRFRNRLNLFGTGSET